LEKKIKKSGKIPHNPGTIRHKSVKQLHHATTIRRTSVICPATIRPGPRRPEAILNARYFDQMTKASSTLGFDRKARLKDVKAEPAKPKTPSLRKSPRTLSVAIPGRTSF
jgi:hypothetical protein